MTDSSAELRARPSRLSAIAGSAFQLAMGTVLGQGIVLLATPYLARTHTPAEFGELAVLMTVSNIAVAAGCLRYDLAIPGAASRDVRALTVTAALSATFSALLVTIVFGVAAAWLPQSALALASGFGWLLPACVLLAGLYQLTSVSLLRRGAYGTLATFRTSQGVVFSGLASLPGVGLLWAHVASFSSGLYALSGVARRPADADHEAWFAVARRNWRIPALSLPGALLDVVAFSLCVWILTDRFGAAAAGNYSQIQRLLGAPLLVASMSLGQVILKQTGDLGDDMVAIRALLGRITRLLVSGAAVLIVAVLFFGEPALRLLLGHQWRVDALFITAVAIAVAARACVSPLSSALFPIRRYDIALAWQVAYFCSASLVLGFLTRALSLERFMIVYAAHEVVLYSVYFALIWTAKPHAVGAPTVAVSAPPA